MITGLILVLGSQGVNCILWLIVYQMLTQCQITGSISGFRKSFTSVCIFEFAVEGQLRVCDGYNAYNLIT